MLRPAACWLIAGGLLMVVLGLFHGTVSTACLSIFSGCWAGINRCCHLS